MSPPKLVHASAVVLGESSVLIRGEAGAGKSTLALALLAAAPPGRFARLVGDDRVSIEARGGRLLVRPVDAIAGLVERRGLGLTPCPHEPGAVVALVVDLVEGDPARLPEPEDLVVELAGVTLPRIRMRRQAADPQHVIAALALFAGGEA